MGQVRIYLVTEKTAQGDTVRERLVQGSSGSQCVRYCAEPIFSAKVAKSTDVARLMKDGAKLEDASETETNGDE